MFSERCNWDLSPNPITRLLEAKRAAGEKVIDLTASNPTKAGFLYPEAKIRKAISQPGSIFYEPDSRGLGSARRAVAAYYRQRGEEIDPDSILLTAGTSEAYGFIFKLIGDPGDEVLIPHPGYPLLSYLSSLESLRYVYYPLRYGDSKGWRIDLEILSALITSRTRAIVLVHPNNPTGSYVKQEEWEGINRLCEGQGIVRIVDEVFFDFSSERAPDRVRSVSNDSGALTFVLNGFSKILGLPQMKLGWIVTAGDPGVSRPAGERLETIADFYLSVGTPVQLAAESLLLERKSIQEQIQTRLLENEAWLKRQAAKKSNFRVLIREGGWYAILSVTHPSTDEEIACRLLETENTLIHPGSFYEFHRDGFFVVSLLTPPDDFREGATRFFSCFGV
jgi:aspartate/methionine/tyrosine aminotransferase